jgi:hypothetical protein
VQIDFSGARSIGEVGVFAIQDNHASPSEPTEGMTFGHDGFISFEVQYRTGATWATVPGGSVSGNDKVRTRLQFAPVNTTGIRVLVDNALAGYSRIVEVEAWGPP